MYSDDSGGKIYMSFESVRDFKKGKEVSISEVIQFNVPL